MFLRYDYPIKEEQGVMDDAITARDCLQGILKLGVFIIGNGIMENEGFYTSMNKSIPPHPMEDIESILNDAITPENSLITFRPYGTLSEDHPPPRKRITSSRNRISVFIVMDKHLIM